MSTDEAPVGVDMSTTTGPLGSEALGTFVGLASDPTGILTFERYLWQAKLAVRAWLGILGGTGIIAVVCEHVEDLAIVETTGYRFAQLKTRDKGSWSASKICESGHAIHKLVASYKLAKDAGIARMARFEVWLEGPPSEQKETTIFFADPSSASEGIKRKIRGLGITGAALTDFLKRLSIHCHQPARQGVDALNVRLIGAIWPGQSMTQIENLYATLLGVAGSAQSASEPPLSVRTALQAGRDAPYASGVWDPIASQVLTEQQLRSLCPPLTADTDQDLIARAASGEATVLELKLVRAGASEETVRSALLARADADVVATGARASGSMNEDTEGAFDTRLLSVAGSVASLAGATGISLSCPAEYIFHNLMSSVANTAAIDVHGIYNRDHRLVVGHLCSVSDQCRFGWGLS